LKRVLCLFVLILAALPALFLNTVFGYMPLLFTLMLLAISGGCLIWMRNRIEIMPDSEEKECVRGGSVRIGLKIVSHSRLAFPSANALIEISDLGGKTAESSVVRFAIDGKGTVDLGFSVEMPHIGCYTVSLRSIILYDFFEVFRMRMPISEQITVTVTPRIHHIENFEFSEDVTAEAQSETRISVAGGSDYTGVRAYVLGDSMKQIHWKISAHTHEYMTKIQESNRQQEFSVILDFAAAQPRGKKLSPEILSEQLMNINDCLVETALSVLEEIAARDNSGALLYADKTQTVVRSARAGSETDADLIRSFHTVEPSPGPYFPDAAAILLQESQRQNRSSSVVIVTSSIIPELLQEIMAIKQQHRFLMLYCIVPAEYSSREVEDLRITLGLLEELAFPYYICRCES